MKKKITLISVILLILLAFTACNNDNDPAQIYLDYQEFSRYQPNSSYLTQEAMSGNEAKEIVLTKDNYGEVFNTSSSSSSYTLENYIRRIEQLSPGSNTTFAITDVSGTYKYTPTEEKIDENTTKRTTGIEFNNIVVKYTLTRDGENEKPQEFQVSFNYKFSNTSTRTITETETSFEYKYEYDQTTTYSINGENKGTVERKAFNSSTTDYTVTSLVFNGTDITRFYNTMYR